MILTDSSGKPFSTQYAAVHGGGVILLAGIQQTRLEMATG
jgi:hypothetical protein